MSSNNLSLTNVLQGKVEKIGLKLRNKMGVKSLLVEGLLLYNFSLVGQWVDCVCRGQPPGVTCRLNRAEDCSRCTTSSFHRCCTEFAPDDRAGYITCMNKCCPDRDGDRVGDWYDDHRGRGVCFGPHFTEPVPGIIDLLVADGKVLRFLERES
jgi:hypothetical protein